MQFVYRPIVSWPGPMTAGRKRALFKAGLDDTLKLLRQELRHLGATSAVIQLAMRESDFLADGSRPKVGIRGQHPGVILSFTSRHGPLSYPCDRYGEWADNLRAVALSLEHLRAVDRYGVTRRGEQYAGWKAIPLKDDGLPRTVEEAAALLGCYLQREASSVSNSEYVLSARRNFDYALRYALLATHPDRGGDPAAFRRVQAAKELLEAYFCRA